jgi:hypothetical protein
LIAFGTRCELIQLVCVSGLLKGTTTTISRLDNFDSLFDKKAIGEVEQFLLQLRVSELDGCLLIPLYRIQQLCWLLSE